MMEEVNMSIETSVDQEGVALKLGAIERRLLATALSDYARYRDQVAGDLISPEPGDEERTDVGWLVDAALSHITAAGAFASTAGRVAAGETQFSRGELSEMREALDETCGADPTEAEASLIREVVGALRASHGVESQDGVTANHEPQTQATPTPTVAPAAPSSDTAPCAPRQLRESPRRVYEIDLEMDQDTGPELE